MTEQISPHAEVLGLGLHFPAQPALPVVQGKKGG